MRQSVSAQSNGQLDELSLLFVENLPFAAALLDRDLNYLMTSPRWLSALELGEQNIIGRSHSEIFPHGDEQLQAAYQQCLTESIELCIEAPFTQPNGTLDWYKWDIHPWQDRTGEMGGILLAVENITQRKQAEAALRESEAELQAIIDHCPAVIYLKSTQGQLIRVNRKFEDLFHMTAAQIKGKTSYDLFPQEVADRHLENDQKLLDSGKPILEEEAALHDDGLHTYLSHKFLVFNAEGVPSAIGGISTDISDRKALEIQLATQKVRFDAFFSAANAGLVIYDDQLRYTHINPSLAEMNGFPVKDHIGKSISDIIPDIAPILQPMLQNILDTRQPMLDYELVGETPKRPGVTGYWLASYYPLMDEESQVFGVGGVVIDISEQQAALRERKQAEKALAESEAKFRLLVENASDLIWSSTLDGTLTYISPRFYDMAGYEPSEFLGRTFAPLLHPEDLPRCFAFLSRVVETGQKQSGFEFRYIRKDGSWFWAMSNVSPIKDAEGSVVGFQGIIRDVSDLKQAEESLHLYTQQLEAQTQREQLINRLTCLIRNSLDFDNILATTLQEVQKFLSVERCSFAWYQPEAQESYWEIVQEARSPHLPNLIGCYPTSAMGWLANQLLNLEMLRVSDVETVDDPVWRAFVRSLDIQAVLAIPIQLPSGAIGTILCTHGSEPRCWGDSEVELLQIVIEQFAIALNQANLYTQTLTKAQELEQALQELQQTQAQLVQTEKMSSLGQLVAGVAHEINNPVNFIYGNLTHASEYMQDLLHLLSLYQQHYPTPHPDIQDEAEAVDLEFLVQDLPKLLTSMKVGADRIQKIVLALRNFSRMDEAEVKAVDIHEGIDSTLTILHNRIKDRPDRRGIEVIKQYGNLPLVECYAGQLNQVFMNVLANAIDALDDRDSKRAPQDIKQHPSQIIIRTEVLDRQRVQISISDNGVGIPETVRRRLFEPFFTTKPIGKGTGLGLSISYQVVVEKHGGELQCISSPGKGAEFLITLPLVANPKRN